MPCQILKVKRNRKRKRPRKISARRIIEIFDENLANARLTSFNKQINFLTLRKLDYGKLKLTTLLTPLTTNAMTLQKSTI